MTIQRSVPVAARLRTHSPGSNPPGRDNNPAIPERGSNNHSNRSSNSRSSPDIPEQGSNNHSNRNSSSRSSPDILEQGSNNHSNRNSSNPSSRIFSNPRWL